MQRSSGVKWPSSHSPPAWAAGGRPARASVKAVNPFVQIDGRHREFPGDPFRQDRENPDSSGAKIPHVVTTSYLTHAAIERHLTRDIQLRSRWAGLPLAWPIDRPAFDPHGPRPRFPLGGIGRTRRFKRPSKRSARPRAGRSSNGPRARGKASTTRITFRSSASTRPVTSMKCRTCS